MNRIKPFYGVNPSRICSVFVCGNVQKQSFAEPISSENDEDPMVSKKSVSAHGVPGKKRRLRRSFQPPCGQAVFCYETYFAMQHIYIVDYQRLFILIGTTSVFTSTQNVGTNANRCISWFCIYVLYRLLSAILWNVGYQIQCVE